MPSFFYFAKLLQFQQYTSGPHISDLKTVIKISRALARSMFNFFSFNQGFAYHHFLNLNKCLANTSQVKTVYQNRIFPPWEIHCKSEKIHSHLRS